MGSIRAITREAYVVCMVFPTSTLRCIPLPSRMPNIVATSYAFHSLCDAILPVLAYASASVNHAARFCSTFIPRLMRLCSPVPIATQSSRESYFKLRSICLYSYSYSRASFCTPFYIMPHIIVNVFNFKSNKVKYVYFD